MISVPAAFIKDIAIEIDPNYQFDNSPFAVDDTSKSSSEDASVNTNSKEEKIFIGREWLKAKFLRFLLGDEANGNNAEFQNGVYLVTGYRGMGKTSFVNYVFGQYREKHSKLVEKQRVEKITINLASNMPSELDILKAMVDHVYDAYVDKSAVKQLNNDKNKTISNRKKMAVIALLLLLPTLTIFKPELIENFFNINYGSLPLALVLPIARIVTLGFLIYAAFKIKQLGNELFPNEPQDEITQEIINLQRRCHASDVVEKIPAGFSLDQWNLKMNEGIQKQTSTYGIASSKEIEYQLSQFLRNCKNCKFIFVFDELDKIDPTVINNNYYDEIDTQNIRQQLSHIDQLRERRQAIINIIAGLKSFLSTANARFIFIAGREMFDASLADVSDRQSSLGSIFNYVFYIESFLKEPFESSLKGSDSLEFIERYVGAVLFGAGWLKKQQSLYDALTELWLESADSNQQSGLNSSTLDTTQYHSLWKMITTIQKFIIYLSYRSNGSPKKIIKTIHEFIRVYDGAKDIDSQLTFCCKKSQQYDGTRSYLYFRFNDQYRIGFITYMYYPFVVNHAMHYRKYSDNILIATSYLFDHLLKFHPFAFSFSHLELIPEVLSTSKTPSLREYIISIVDYLSKNHIRETEIGLFDYKFYSRTLNELSFISKTFEEESAAFNFTLDEGYLVKLHIKSELTNNRKIYGSDSVRQTSIYSRSHLYTILGDLHFFDQEYDDAIVAYSDGLWSLNRSSIATSNFEDFVAIIRFQLKIGLTFEKRKSYDEALAFYTDACENTKWFLSSRLNSGIKMSEFFEQDDSIRPGAVTNQHFHTSMLSDLLQITNQAFLAKIVLQEKMGIEGITQKKFSLTLNSFFSLANEIADVCGKNYLIYANFYLVLGNLLYFKNSPQGFDDVEGTYPSKEYALFQNLKTKFSFPTDFSFRKPLLALYYYIMGLREVLITRCENNQLPLFENFDFSNLLQVVHGWVWSNVRVKTQDVYTKVHYRYIAIFLSNIGDSLLSSFEVEGLRDKFNPNVTPALQGKDKHHTMGFNKIFVLSKLTQENITTFPELLPPITDQRSISDILHCYYWSAFYFKKQGRMVSYSFQLRKILYVLRLVLNQSNSGTSTNHATSLLNHLKNFLLNPILDVAGLNVEFSNDYIEKKYKKIWEKQSLEGGLKEVFMNPKYKNDFQEYISNNSSNHPDAREALSLFYYIQLKLDIEDSKLSGFLTAYSSFSTQYTRIFELELWGKYNSLKYRNASEQPIALRLKYAGEFLYCMLSKLATFEMYGTDYTIGNSYQSYTHYQLANFLLENKSLFEQPDMTQVIGSICDLLSYPISDFLFEPGYHYQKAIYYYRKAISLHTGGQEYKANFDNIIYLEDDINDNAYHFGAAMDRYLLVNKVFDLLISECEAKLKTLNNNITPNSGAPGTEIRTGES